MAAVILAAVTTTSFKPTAARWTGSGGAPRWATLAQSTTFRNWRATLLWTIAAVLFAQIFYPFDRYGFALDGARPRSYRMFIYPSEIPMRVFGIPHFLIALAFTLTSSRMRVRRNWFRFAGLAIASALLCALFLDAGAQRNALAIFLFYAYFIVHQFRDDTYFYEAYGEVPSEARRSHERILTRLRWLSLAVLFAIAWPVYTTLGVQDFATGDSILSVAYPAAWSLGVRLAVTSVPAFAAVALVLRWIARTLPGGVPELWRVHRPMLVIQLASMAIILFALVGGTWAINLVVLMHFVGWYLFALYQLGQRPPATPPDTIWKWMRTTRAGFMTLHLGLAAAVGIGIAVDVYGFGQQSWLYPIVGAHAFYYWTIAHVTLSFLPR